MPVDQRTKTSSGQLFDRRTVIVLGSLIASMTAACALLMAIQPMPIAPSGGLALAVVDATPASIDAVLNTKQSPEVHGWRSIVIHHTGQSTGNAQSLGQLHQQLGYGGLGYHFVIGNGDGTEDGQIQVGYRWVRQIEGVYAAKAISVCLIGNGDATQPTQTQIDQLIRLVVKLQTQLGIPANRVYLHSDIEQTTSPGRLFPAARFRSALAD